MYGGVVWKEMPSTSWIWVRLTKQPCSMISWSPKRRALCTLGIPKTTWPSGRIQTAEEWFWSIARMTCWIKPCKYPNLKSLFPEGERVSLNIQTATRLMLASSSLLGTRRLGIFSSSSFLWYYVSMWECSWGEVTISSPYLFVFQNSQKRNNGLVGRLLVLLGTNKSIVCVSCWLMNQYLVLWFRIFFLYFFWLLATHISTAFLHPS